MFKQDDWQCTECDKTGPHLVWVKHGDAKERSTMIECTVCAVETTHERRMSAPARYTYDLPYAPMVSGGTFDTTGNRQPPRLPELPDGADMDHARDHFNSASFKEIKNERHEVFQQNAVKKKRAAAMKKHPTMDIRNTPVPGDPANS